MAATNEIRAGETTCPACACTRPASPVVEATPAESAPMLECPGCATQFTPDRSAAAPSWYAEQETYEWRWEFDRFLEDLERLAPPGAKVLEIGCGEGLLLGKLGRYDARGIDFNESAVAVARERGHRALASTLERFRETHPDERFQAVALFHVLEHVPDPLGFLERLSGLIGRDGFLGLSTPNPGRLMLLVERERWDFPPHHLQRFSREGLSKLLERAGFGIVRSLDQPAEDESVWLAKVRAYRGLPLPKKLRELVKLPVFAVLAAYGAYLRRTRTGLSWYVVATKKL